LRNVMKRQTVRARGSLLKKERVGWVGEELVNICLRFSGTRHVMVPT
jgi:hypothetical protein